MQHIFLIEPAEWTAQGQFTDADGVSSETIGAMAVIHERGAWIRDATLYVRSNPALEVRDRYAVKPLAPGHVTTTWTCDHATTGLLRGTLLFSPDTIVSAFSSVTGEYSGSEYLTLETDGHYTAFGSVLRGKRTIASWRVALTRRS